MRTGVIAKKIGMTRVFDENNTHIPVTVLEMKGCKVISKKTVEKDGYNSVQLGFDESVKEKNVSKPMKGVFAKNGVNPLRKIVEFRVSENCLLNSGDEILADHFVEGQFIDVAANSIGKGFAGAMKRHNFAGLEATHGVSISHRSHGSTGQCQDPGRVFKGKKMAGHMGAARTSVQNLKVVGVDVENGLLLVKGAVPGHKGCFVEIKDSVKKIHKDLPMPASVKAGKVEEKKEEAVSA